jgi:hypothetical protein
MAAQAEEPNPAAGSSSLPAATDQAAQQAEGIYLSAELTVVVGSAELVQQAIDDPTRAANLYTDLQNLARRVAADTAAKAGPLAASVAARATTAGDDDARTTIARLNSALGWSPPPGYEIGHDANTGRMIALELASSLSQAAGRITRFADDAYRAATVSGALNQTGEVFDMVAGIITKAAPAEAQAAAWRQLTSRGVTGFTDASGRQWNLATYVEMAVRTATQRAYNASHLDRFTRAGIDYFTISSDGRPCPLCAPWEGKVLAQTVSGSVTAPSALTGDDVTFTVAATIDEARAAGLFHPNCRHTLNPFMPGATILHANDWSDADEARYKALQRQRYLERRVRQARLELAAAITPAQKQQAAQTIRDRAAAAKQFAADNGLVNRPRRQQLNLGLH